MSGKRGMIAGVADDERPGSIQIFRLNMEKVFEIQVHALPVERVVLSFDNNYLFTAGQDGSLFFFDIKDSLMKRDKESIQVPLSEEILTQKSELQELQQAIEHLQRENSQHRIDNQIRYQHNLSKKEEAIQKLSEELESNKQQAMKRREALKKSTEEMENMYNQTIEKMKREFEEELANRKKEYEQKKAQDAIRLEDLQQQKQEEENLHQEKLADLYEQHSQVIKKMQEDYKIEIEEQSKKTAILSQQIKQMEIENKEIRDQIENDAWEEIDSIKEKNKEELLKITKIGMDSKAELQLTNNKFLEQKKNRDSLVGDIQEKQTLLNGENTKTKSFRQEIQGQKNEITEREKTIKDKDERIYDLKKKTQELEKFKFVLDYKIKELKRDIGPREIEIQKLKEQTSKMQQELKHFNRVNQNLGLIVDDLRMRQEGLQNEVKKQRTDLEGQETYKKKFKDDVYECMQYINEYKPLKQSIIRLHKKYVKEEIKNDQGDADLQKEYAQQRKYLEKSVDYLRRMISKDSDVHRQENNRIMKENVTLLIEINHLRQELKNLKKRAKRQGVEPSMGDNRSHYHDGEAPEEIMKELGMQDAAMEELMNQIKDVEDENNMLLRQRSRQGARLPPIEAEQMDQDMGEGPGGDDSMLQPSLGQVNRPGEEEEETKGGEMDEHHPSGHEDESPGKDHPLEAKHPDHEDQDVSPDRVDQPVHDHQEEPQETQEEESPEKQETPLEESPQQDPADQPQETQDEIPAD